MNEFTATGALPRAARVYGNDKKVLRFTLHTAYAHNAKTGKASMAYVPCVVFEPTPEIENLLIQNWKSAHIEVRGHVSSSKFEKNGETKYSTDVIVNRSSIKVVPAPAPYFSEEAAVADTEQKAA